ncbi:hypothetical protein ACEWY4_018040 [Coilia grayii]|uniref:Reverse transcriptase n=1 Tax=Coilia grayii TaxID=363190 RepID=A0ABD1JIJ9_9TELE
MTFPQHFIFLVNRGRLCCSVGGIKAMTLNWHHSVLHSGSCKWSVALSRLQVDSCTVTIAPNKVAKNLGVVIDDRLSFSDHIASVARSCRYALYNIRKIRLYLTQYATQLLVQAMVISCLDYCNALLVGLPACAIKPLQRVQNAAARLVFNQPKRLHVTPLFINLHWLPVAARIQHKALTLAYKVTSGSAPTYLNVIVNAYIPSRMLRSSNANRLAVPSPKTKRGHSKLFSVVVPQLWNNLPVQEHNFPLDLQKACEDPSFPRLLNKTKFY